MLIDEIQFSEARQKFKSSRSDLWIWCQTNCLPYGEVLMALGQTLSEWDVELDYYQDLSGVEIYTWDLTPWELPKLPDIKTYEKAPRYYARSRKVTCAICSREFRANRKDAVFCGNSCVKRAHRQRKRTQKWLANLHAAYNDYITWLQEKRPGAYKDLIEIHGRYQAGTAVLKLLSEVDERWKESRR